MKILVFAASLRKNSLNRILAARAVRALQAMKVEVDHADFREFEMPMYDGDFEERDGVPASAKEFAKRFAGADAVVISTPEYNGNMPGTFKNVIDWGSRVRPLPYANKPVLILGASPGAFGAIRGMSSARLPLEQLGAFVFPQLFGVPHADTAFSPDGEFVDAANKAKLEKLLSAFVEFAGALSKK